MRSDESAEFKECVAKLADLLGIQQHPTDVRVTFRALAKYAEKYISTNVKPLNSETQKRQTPLANVDLGFDLNGQHTFLPYLNSVYHN